MTINCSCFNNDKNQLPQTKYGTEKCLEWWKTEDIRVNDFPSIFLLRNIILVIDIVALEIVPQNTCLETLTHQHCQLSNNPLQQLIAVSK